MDSMHTEERQLPPERAQSAWKDRHRTGPPVFESLEGSALEPLGGDETTRGQQVLSRLTDAIAIGQLPAGSIWSASQLAEELKVSRTPVREALVVLQDRGLVNFERNRGARIVTTRDQDLAVIFEQRFWLEPRAAQKAANRFTPTNTEHLRADFEGMQNAIRRGDLLDFLKHDRAFHWTILNVGNPRCADYVDGLRNFLLLRSATTVTSGLRNVDDIAADHYHIMVAIENADGDLAAKCMKRHLENTARLVLTKEAYQLMEIGDNFDE